MNGKDIFLELGDIGEDLIAEAEYGRFSKAETAPRPCIRRPVLIAALIALMLLLVGCAVVYALKMQNLNLGQKEVTYDAFDYDTLEYLGKETYVEDVLTVAGLKGSAEYKAAQEWFAFLQSYDPDRAIQSSVWGSYPQFPAAYDTYNLYSQDMKDALDEILEKYSLKPVGAPLEFRNTRNLCAALGIDRLMTAGNSVTLRVNDGICYENGNFQLNLDILLPEAAGNELDTTWANLRWNRSDCFSGDVIAMNPTDDWKEWNYTTSGGSEVLILRSDADWRGYILCQRPDGILSLQLETRKDLWNNEDGRTWAEELFLTDAQLEQIADAVDSRIQPRKVTREDAQNQPPIPTAATQNGYTVELKSLQTDGWITRIVVGIAAPEGTVISRNPHPGFEAESYHIGPGNYDNFTCQTGEISACDGGWNLMDDGDGLDNTQDIVMVTSVHMKDGTAPFDPGMVWNLYFADLIGSYWDETYTDHVDILAEGEWLFPIVFDETIGDYAEQELIRDPIAVGVSVGWRPDGSDVVEDVTVSSFQLRRFSASIAHTGGDGTDFSYLNGEYLKVVMKDGTHIQLSGHGSLYHTDVPIDPAQVDHIEFADGTRLPLIREAIS